MAAWCMEMSRDVTGDGAHEPRMYPMASGPMTAKSLMDLMAIGTRICFHSHFCEASARMR